jgi:predicted O-methyltransferase YrrM
MSLGAQPVRFQEKMLPCQPAYREHFIGDDEQFYQTLYEALLRFGGLRLPTDEFRLQLSDRVAIEEQASNPVGLRFLEILIQLKQPRRILEVGTFIGISALTMARALAPDGRVVTIERYDHFAELARQNVRANGFAEKIDILVGDAGELLPTLDPSLPFDMIFLDGDKDHYDQHFRRLDALLAPSGLLVVDDVLFHGDGLNEQPRTPKGAGVRRFLEQVQQRPDYRKVLLPLGNGVMIMVKSAQ